MSQKQKTINEKKAACGYITKCIPSTCSNCANYTSERVLTEWMESVNARRGRTDYTIEEYGIERNLRCIRHGFVVRKMGVCNDWTKNEGGSK